MENNIDIVEKMKLLTTKYTPEYLAKLEKKCYEDDREYPENFSNWYPCIKDFGNFKHAEIISNQIFTFEEVHKMQKTENIDDVNWEIWYEILRPTIEKMERRTWYSIKNGCYSNKFDFETSINKSKLDLPKNLFKINYNSTMYDTGGYTELVVREYIPYDPDHTITIYNGMPLRTEVRVFYNMDTKEIEYIEDYWNYDYCSKHINKLNDKLLFDLFHNKSNISLTDHSKELNKVMKFIEENINTLKIEGLKGVWSIDFMYDRDLNSTYLIDMARGFRSAYWNPNKLKNEIKI